MMNRRHAIYDFGDFSLNEAKRLLFRRGEPVPMSPKVFDTLLQLVQHHGKTVAKDDLVRAVWPDTVVEENNLNQNISALRRILGETRGENRFIATVPGKGYQFVPDVEVSTRMEAGGDRVIIAVLPFDNLSGDPDRDYLTDGLTEELIAALGQIDPDRLSVIGRRTMMAYKHGTKTLAEIGRELEAAYLVESSMRSERGRLRITSKLIRASGQAPIWSMSYDSEPRSMLEFQREISGAISEQVRLQVSPERLSAIARRQTRHPEAYDLYLRGRYFWNQLSPATTRQATEFFARAGSIDPNYALAWSGLADSYTASPINGDAAPLVVRPLARQAVAQAMGSDPNLAASQTSYGLLQFWLEWDWASAESAFRRAIDIDPHYSLAHRMLGIVLAHRGRYQEAADAMRRARELDPMLAGHHALSSQVAFMGRHFDTALQLAKQSIVLDPQFWIGYMQLGQAYEQVGEFQRALDALNEAARLSAGNSKPLSLRGYVLAKTSRFEEASDMLRMLQKLAGDRNIPPYAFALIHAGLGQQDQTLDSLEQALEVRDVHLAFLPNDVKWDPFRGNPRFVALLEHCGFATSGTVGAAIRSPDREA
ncbi:MAG TPA: tetratricopeptide repeat protein [Verrucomicrobiae bacterium]|nr:tetratricopeptide repeat protein [Verrucomicrobiae bacterium]